MSFFNHTVYYIYFITEGGWGLGKKFKGLSKEKHNNNNT